MTDHQGSFYSGIVEHRIDFLTPNIDAVGIAVPTVSATAEVQGDHGVFLAKERYDFCPPHMVRTKTVRKDDCDIAIAGNRVMNWRPSHFYDMFVLVHSDTLRLSESSRGRDRTSVDGFKVRCPAARRPGIV